MAGVTRILAALCAAHVVQGVHYGDEHLPSTDSIVPDEHANHYATHLTDEHAVNMLLMDHHVDHNDHHKIDMAVQKVLANSSRKARLPNMNDAIYFTIKVANYKGWLAGFVDKAACDFQGAKALALTAAIKLMWAKWWLGSAFTNMWNSIKQTATGEPTCPSDLNLLCSGRSSQDPCFCNTAAAKDPSQAMQKFGEMALAINKKLCELFTPDIKGIITTVLDELEEEFKNAGDDESAKDVLLAGFKDKLDKAIMAGAGDAAVKLGTELFKVGSEVAGMLKQGAGMLSGLFSWVKSLFSYPECDAGPALELKCKGWDENENKTCIPRNECH